MTIIAQTISNHNRKNSTFLETSVKQSNVLPGTKGPASTAIPSTLLLLSQNSMTT